MTWILVKSETHSRDSQAFLWASVSLYVWVTCFSEDLLIKGLRHHEVSLSSNPSSHLPHKAYPETITFEKFIVLLGGFSVSAADREIAYQLILPRHFPFCLSIPPLRTPCNYPLLRQSLWVPSWILCLRFTSALGLRYLQVAPFKTAWWQRREPAGNLSKSWPFARSWLNGTGIYIVWRTNICGPLPTLWWVSHSNDPLNSHKGIFLSIPEKKRNSITR